MIFGHIQDHNPEKIALRDQNCAVRYGDLMQEIQKRIDALRDVSVLAIAIDNNVEWVLWDLAALKAGIVCVPLPPFFTQEQISHAIRSAGVTHIACSGDLDNISKIRKTALPTGTAKITFTSGTTGKPKGVCLPKSAMENVASSVVNALGKEFAGIHASVLPLAVLLENVAGVYAGLMAGCMIHLASFENFGKNYEHIHDVLKAAHANSAILVPEILRALMAQGAVKGPLPDLKFIAVGGSKIDPALIMQARKMGLPVYEGYGLSECASVVSLNTPKDDMPGSVGKPLSHAHVQIADGEIRIKNPGFLGYIGEAAPDVLYTGDLGQMDKDGFLSVTGRKKNVLITSYGRNVCPEWVESVLLAQPSIAQVIVHGDAQPQLSALIVPSSAKADIQAAVDAANQSLPDYAQIKDFQIVPLFTVAGGTLTGTGRPRREQILNLYKKDINNELLQQTG